MWTPDSGSFERNRCIAFDAVGTLLQVQPSVAALYADAARRHGSRLSQEEVARRFPEVFRRVDREDFGPTAEEADLDWTRPDRLTTSEPRERERWRKIVARLIDDVADPEACFEELFERFARPSSWTCFPDVGETLQTLADRGYRLAVASNFDARLHALCDGLPELRPLSIRVISSEAGYRKPSPHFYRTLAQAAGCRPEEVLMVGDDPQGDVAGARRAGLHAIWLRRGKPSEGENWISNLCELVKRLDGGKQPESLNSSLPARPG